MAELNQRSLACIIGGSSGIGLAVARMAAPYFNEVIIASRDNQNLLNAVEELSYPNVRAKVFDASSAEQRKMFLAQLQEHNHLHAAVVFSFGGPAVGPVSKYGTADLKDEFDRYFFPIYDLARGLAEQFVDHGTKGRFVFIGSTSALRSLHGFSCSNIMRSALTGLVGSLVDEYACRQMTFNMLCPAAIRTTRLDLVMQQRQNADSYLESIPMRCFGSPEQVASIALPLMKSECFVNGAVIPVDGGKSCLE